MNKLKKCLMATSKAGVLATALALPVSAPVFAGGDEGWMLEDLKEQIDNLNKRLQEVEHMQPLETLDGAAKKYVRKGNDKLWVKLSGHVNRAVLWGSNDDQSEFFNVDNDASATRLRVEAGKQINDDWSIGTNIEIQLKSNAIANIRFNKRAGTDEDDTISERKLEFFARSETYGTWWFGHGNTASFLTGSSDLSGTDIVLYSGVADIASGLNFEDSPILVGNVFNDFNGAGRDDRVRYDTPRFYGFVLSGSVRDGGELDTGLTFSKDFDGIRVAASAGMATNYRGGGTDEIPFADDTDNDIYAASASVLLPSGLNLTVSGGWRDSDHDDDQDDDNDASSYYIKLGYLFNWCRWGQTAVAIDYGHSDNVLDDDVFDNEDSDADAYGIALVQNIDDLATELYIAYRHYELDVDDVESSDEVISHSSSSLEGEFDSRFGDDEDIDVVIAGARIKF